MKAMTTGLIEESPVRCSGVGSLLVGRCSLMNGWMPERRFEARCSGLFVAAGAGHEFADGFFGAFVVVEDGVHLLGDGHLDGVAGGEAEGCGGAADSFGDFAVEAGDDVGELAAAAQLDAYGAVAREGAGAGEDEVADCRRGRRGSGGGLRRLRRGG